MTYFAGYGEFSEEQQEMIRRYLGVKARALLLWNAQQELRLLEEERGPGFEAISLALQPLIEEAGLLKQQLQVQGVVVGPELWD
jgi:hypothetical protein